MRRSTWRVAQVSGLVLMVLGPVFLVNGIVHRSWPMVAIAVAYTAFMGGLAWLWTKVPTWTDEQIEADRRS